MMNIMLKTKRMTNILQLEELNVMDAIKVMEATAHSLKVLNSDTEGMNSEIEAAVEFANNLGDNACSDFERYYPQRRRPSIIDENPLSGVRFDLKTFYRKEFKAVLDTQISFIADVVSNCHSTRKPLFEYLSIGEEKATFQGFQLFAGFFPEDVRPDPLSLMSDIQTFQAFIESRKMLFSTLAYAAKFTEEQKSVFPLISQAYRLALTAPVTVAKDERAFSKLKLVITLNRSKVLDERLEQLNLMACERDITDKIRVEKLATIWATLKSRRVILSNK